MIWNYTDKAELVMKNLDDGELKNYLSKISDKILYAYNVYQIEGEGKKLFSEIKGDKNSKVEGLLEEFNLTREEGDQLILEARKIWHE